MKTRNAIIGFIFLLGIVVIVFTLKGKAKVNSLPVPSPIATPSIQQKLKNKFSKLIIPDSGDQIDLNDVSGSGGMGIATKNEILADLPELPLGQSYQAFLSDLSGKTVLLGNLKTEKGGWILQYNMSNYPDYKKIVIRQGSTNILEGSF